MCEEFAIRTLASIWIQSVYGQRSNSYNRKAGLLCSSDSSFDTLSITIMYESNVNTLDVLDVLGTEGCLKASFQCASMQGFLAGTGSVASGIQNVGHGTEERNLGDLGLGKKLLVIL